MEPRTPTSTPSPRRDARAPVEVFRAGSLPLRAPVRKRRRSEPAPRPRLELPVGDAGRERPAATPSRDPSPDESARGVAIVDFYI